MFFQPHLFDERYTDAMKEKLMSWEVRGAGGSQKTSAWYWTVGIIALGAAAASIIVGNVLLGVLAVMGAFAVMLAGSLPQVNRTYALSETGFHLGNEVIPFGKIKRFALHEDEPRTLTLDTTSLAGVTTIPLGSADFRRIRSELKNRNIDEVDTLGSVAEKIATSIGM